MARFSKAAVLAFLSDRISFDVKNYGFDLNKDQSQLIGKLDNTNAKCAYGTVRLFEELVKQIKSKDFKFNKTNFENDLLRRIDEIQALFKFNLNTGTFQLKGSFFGSIEAHMGYQALRSCEMLLEVYDW